MKRYFDWVLAGSIVLMAAALVWVVSGTLQDRVVQAGDRAPDFSIKTEDGRTVSLSNFGGKLLVLNFWASWCQPCVEETPSLEQFARQFQPQGVVVLGVSIDRNERLYRQFIERFGITFKTARDPESNISASYGTFQIPETYLIDRNGVVLEKVISNRNWMEPEFIDRVRRML